MLKSRIIPCLDVNNGRVVKGTNFVNLKDAGDPVEIAKIYDAVCTPDFFAYNSDMELQYRGRIKQLKDLKPINDDESELFKALILISKTGQGPKEQHPSMGCNIKWVK